MLDLNTINILKKQGHIIRSDNTLHGFTKARIVQMVRCLENNWAAALERCENQYKTLCGYHEKQEKYAWHDLRKNPDDLPEEDERHLLVYTNGVFCVWNAKLLRMCMAGVDAWKRIEPFEEGE